MSARAPFAGVLRPALVIAVAALALVAALVASLALGAINIPFGDVISYLTGGGDAGPDKQIVTELRLPRTIEALAVGASLGVAGALLQGALANPLASPDVIGVTGGSAFGAILIILVAPEHIALLPVGALAFGLLAAGVVFVVASAGPTGGSVARLILAGIAISSLFAAGTSALMNAYPDRVPSAVFFLAGGLTTNGWENIGVVWPYLAAGLVLAACLTRPLDRLALGDDVAASLGSRPRAIRLTAGIAAALLAAGAAALAGILVFVGLVVPHVVRMAGGIAGHGFVVPASALTGAALLLAGDTLARTVVAPTELPVGPFMAVIGVPLFLWLLNRTV